MRIISRSQVDFNNLLDGIHKSTGKRVADGVDKLNYEVNDDVKLGLCLAALTGHDPVSPAIESHLHFTVMVLIEEYDFQTVMSCAPLTWCGSTTTARGWLVGVLSGNMTQWRAAIASGECQMDGPTAKFYADLKTLFINEGFKFDAPPMPRVGQ